MPPEAVSGADIWTNLGILIGAAVAMLAGYYGPRVFGRAPLKQDSVIASVGVELGNREQMERLISEVKRIADAITDKNTAGINDRLEELAAQLEAMNEVPRRRRGNQS